jgi:hypothetical protein
VEDDARGRPTATGRALPPILTGLADPTERSPYVDTCPFFRSIAVDGMLAPPIEVPDAANRCLAVGEPKPQSVRQQELVCLTTGHVNCPRYLRGALVTSRGAHATLPRPTASPSVIASLLVLVLTATASVGFLLANGGMALALPWASPGLVAAASPPVSEPPATAAPSTPESTASPSVVASPTPAPTTPTAAPSATAASSATPVPTVAPTPAPTAPPPTPARRSDRYAVLDPCPGAADCWIYTVRAGDNFRSIVNWFGVPYDTVARMNPQLGDLTSIHVGDRIRMPPPTR